ncbi:MAG: OmpL47-type beta-barrel domain-containing protein, partial [Solirubrobacteraceae bacterium]
MRSLTSLGRTAARTRGALLPTLACLFALAGATPAGAQGPVNIFTTIGITEEGNKQNSAIRGPYSLPAEEMPPSRQIVIPPDDDEDDVPLRMPNTSGTVANLAEFRGQTLTLREEDRGVFPRVHFFGTTADGSGGGDFTLSYSDGTSETVNVFFPDWCQMGTTDEHHPAIGPLSHRHTPTGQDGAPCGVFHMPADGLPEKTLVSVTLPPSTDGSGGNTRSYLMALTLETADGDFVTPDLGASPFPDDLEAPVSAHTLDPAAPDGEAGWYTSGVEVALTAEDEAGGSQVERTEYSVDGAGFVEYDGAFTVSGDGRHTVAYRSIDRAGNTETPKVAEVNIDGTAPTTEGSLSPARPAPSGWYDRAVELTLRGRDGAGSGAALIEYSVGGGGFVTYDGPVTFDRPGTYSVAFRSTDAAGNEGTAGEPLTFKVDGEAPSTSALIDGAAPAQNYSGPVTVSLAAADGEGGSGVAATEYSLDGGDWQAYGGPFTVSGSGVHVLDYRSADAAGNLENAREAVFRIGVLTQPGGGGGGGGGGVDAAPAPAPAPWAAIVEDER